MIPFKLSQFKLLMSDNNNDFSQCFVAICLQTLICILSLQARVPVTISLVRRWFPWFNLRRQHLNYRDCSLSIWFCKVIFSGRIWTKYSE